MWNVKGWYDAAFKQAREKRLFHEQMADLQLTTYQKAFPEVSIDEIARKLAKSNRKRLDAVPELAKYPELRGVRDLMDARWRGLRDGAELSASRWAAACDGNYLYRRHLGESAAMTLGCTYVYFGHSDCGPLLANNLDSTPAEPFGPPEWLPGDSEHVILGAVSSGVWKDEKTPEIFPAPMYELVSRYCRTTDETVEMLTRYNYFWGPCNMLVIDRGKNVAMIEKSNCRIGVRRRDDGFGFITAMTAEEPDMRAFHTERRAEMLKDGGKSAPCSETVYWEGADHRRELLEELIDEAKAEPTLEKIRSIIQFRDKERGLVCYNAEEILPGGPPCEYTLKTTIWQMAKGRALWWAKEGDTPSFENKKPDVEFSDVWLWE